jgi:hypothetical protein
MGVVGRYFQYLQEKRLPYYDEKLRRERFSMLKDGCQYFLDHIPRFIVRGLFFQDFDALCRAFQGYLQVLFVGRAVYPIVYNKWVRYQIESLLNDHDLYRRLPPILSVSDMESNEVNQKVELLQGLLNEVKSLPRDVRP